MAIRLHGTAGSWTLPEGDTVLGRGDACDIRLADRRLSRRHACFTVQDDMVMVAELGSANPVLLNGDRIAGRTALTHGDALVVGPFLLRIEVAVGVAPRRVSMTAATQVPDAPPADPVPPRGATQAMDPESVANLAHESRRAKAVDPTIAAALGRPPTRRVMGTDRHETARHQPEAWDADAASGALAATATAGGVPVPVAANPPTAKAVTESFPTTSALTPGPHRRLGIPPLVVRRIAAAVLDLLSLSSLALVVALVPLAAGLAHAAGAVGSVIQAGRVVIQPTASTPVLDLLLALLTPTGMAVMPSLARALLDYGGAFPGLFFGFSGAAIAVELVFLFGTVAATVRHGAPLWHRQLGLVLVVRRNGHRLGWLRAFGRWTLALILAPLAAVTIWGGGRSWHDRLSGVEVRSK